MTAAALTTVAASSPRLLADVEALDVRETPSAPALVRLEAVLGRDLADRLVSALSEGPERA